MGHLTNQTTNILFELSLLNEDIATETESHSRVIKLEYFRNQKINDLKTTYNLLEKNKNLFLKDVINENQELDTKQQINDLLDSIM